uniref:Immunoglobulin domain-containing protein n=1 Tax=Gouania willdenowi TaxID=441366 RepID=A0A8C5NA61_GOUWI
NMLVHLSVLLMLSGLTGVSSITTISRVSVKANSFISIPCLYDPKFKTNVKYLCEGEEWPICTYVAKTNEVNSERFRINDDVSQNVFTVRIRFYKNLLNRKGVYWCAVEIIKDPDVMDSFYLSLASGHPLLHVDNQEVTASPGDNVTIKCYYGNAGHSRWCRLGGFCVTGLFGTLDGTHVIIDHNVPGVFTVTMGRVRTESRGWYFCARGSLQMPVHLIIIQQPSTSEYYTKLAHRGGFNQSFTCLRCLCLQKSDSSSALFLQLKVSSAHLPLQQKHLPLQEKHRPLQEKHLSLQMKHLTLQCLSQ